MGGACQEESAVGASGTYREPRSRAGSRQRQLGSTVLHAADWFQLSRLINKMDAQRCPVWSSVGSTHENILSEGHVANASSTHVPTRLEVSWTSTGTLPACPVGSLETHRCFCSSVGGTGSDLRAETPGGCVSDQGSGDVVTGSLDQDQDLRPPSVPGPPSESWTVCVCVFSLVRTRLCFLLRPTSESDLRS